jgi:chaperone required for assembly of F1-ATPase
MTYEAKAPDKKTDSLGFRPKRFWQATGLTEVEGGIGVSLDGKPVKTPKGRQLVLPNTELAQRIADEWAAVDAYVEFGDMPLTRLGFAAVDRMGEVQDDMLAEVTRYSETDLLCYPSEYPSALVAREDAAWLPVLAWADEALGLKFHQNRTLIHTPQPAVTLAEIQSLMIAASPYEQAGIMLAIPLLGSVVLSLALWRGRLSADAAFAASRIGEDFQAETWGRDEEAAQRARNMLAQVEGLETWFRALAYAVA